MMICEVATLNYRERGTYPSEEHCLTCGKFVSPSKPHIFVRDADQRLSDDDALVGLLHPECEQQYCDADAAQTMMLSNYDHHPCRD